MKKKKAQKLQSRYYIKLYHEILHDPKVATLSHEHWRRMIEFFLLASDLNQDGKLPSPNHMAWLLREQEANIVAILHVLAELEVTEQKADGSWWVKNFAKRQAAITSTQRSKAYRAKNNGVQAPYLALLSDQEKE